MANLTHSTDTIRKLTIEHLSSLEIRETDGPFIPHNDGDPIEMPKRVIVQYHLSPAPGSDIVVELWLPEAKQWNGCFVGCGNGGPAGNIHAGVLANRCKDGYAVAQTDLGTSAGPLCGDGNPDVWKDFGYRATELMTRTAKQIIEAYYQRPADWSYFIGSSTGGQQAMQVVQRNPTDYDGVFAGLPAHCRTPLHAYFVWNHQVLVDCPFTEEQEQSVIKAAVQHVAEREPFPELLPMVSNARATQNDIDAVIAKASEIDPSLTANHQAALRKLFAGPTNPETGERIFGGVPLGSQFLKAQHNFYLLQWIHGSDCDLTALNFTDDIETYTEKLAPLLNAENPDISAFKENGGKLLVTSGAADPIVPFHATLDLIERIIEKQGSLNAFNEFCRYFLIPGRGHGQDGPGLNTNEDPLPLLRQWCEQGQAPNALTCYRNEDGKTLHEMSVSPYPNISLTYNGETRQVSNRRGGVEPVAGRYRT